MADAQTLRQLKIKTGVVKRLFKEEALYREEVVAAAAQVDRLKDSGADGADVRNAERVRKDSEQMIPRTRKQLEEGLVALQDLVGALHSDAAVAASQEYKDAFSVVQQVEAAWKGEGQ
ncbi:Tubulin-folding cofactor A [Vanrija pseudolonga]|uniref:Tubulin-specific chaperone A n=1 Tax=Vanrija pseudolonga TaxID=143232 RepID=A0AAF1BN74_9TREE|nr:Tubulin-folding cofactor A [Vanrija pseudolonga]